MLSAESAQCEPAVYSLCVKISVALITLNEEANLPRTLESVQPLVRDGQGEIIVVDSGSTDRTLEIARSFGAKIFIETWKGFAAQCCLSQVSIIAKAPSPSKAAELFSVAAAQIQSSK